MESHYSTSLSGCQPIISTIPGLLPRFFAPKLTKLHSAPRSASLTVYIDEKAVPENSGTAFILYIIVLQSREAEAVYQSVQSAAVLAVGAVTVVIAFVIGKVIHRVDGANGITSNFINSAVN